MTDLEKKLKEALGKVRYYALMKILRPVQIRLDSDDKLLIVYQDGKEPLEICFDCLEDFVNNVH